MKTKPLTIAMILICSLMLAPSLLRADQDDWYQGRQGQWAQVHNEWRFRDRDGNEYRRHGKSWGWYNGRRHGAEGSEYHNRAPGDTRSYNQYQNQTH